MEEYFQAKRELLLDCNSYGDMVAAYPAYWSGLRCLELVILMDARVLGHIWLGQIMGRDPQIEEGDASRGAIRGRSGGSRAWKGRGPAGRTPAVWTRGAASSRRGGGH